MDEKIKDHTSNKKVSVIIPTYNRATTIIKSINSVLNQTYSNFEIVVVDDNSDDNTKDIIKQIQDDRIIYIKNKKNLGAASARNIGIKNATGELIAFQDSDDEWDKTKIEKQIKKLSENEKYGAVYCAFMYIGKESTYQIPDASEPISKLEGNIFENLLQRNTVSTQTLLVKKSVLDSIGIFNDKLKALEDWELALRISREFLFGYINECLVNVYYSENSVNNNVENSSLAQIYIYGRYLKFVLDKRKYIDGILYMLRTINKVQNKKVYEECINKIVSFGILDEFSLMIISKEINRSERFIKKYNFFIDLFSHDNFTKYIKENIENIENNNNAIALYGAGKIGKILYKILKEEKFKPRCIIDKNNIIEDGITVLSKNILPKEIKLIIMTIPYEKKLIEQIKSEFNVKIIMIEELV